MKNWGPPLLIMYALGIFLHVLVFIVSPWPSGIFWVGDMYWVGTGIALFGLAQTLENQKSGRFIPAYFAIGLLRMFLGLGAVILPLMLKEDPNFNASALQFVAAYLFALFTESALAVFWIKKK
ncbi:MAG: hypothetical protein QNK62_03510 [Cryomorphaceae bacterium]|jgi:hypothetical protein|nr:hypothetical protein [Cryomorphaceae bacterium]|tara:strand:+ start:869 stop:1237 length:369 start_codon:yes stop_codon:yes gene_type:complete